MHNYLGEYFLELGTVWCPLSAASIFHSITTPRIPKDTQIRASIGALFLPGVLIALILILEGLFCVVSGIFYMPENIQLITNIICRRLNIGNTDKIMIATRAGRINNGNKEEEIDLLFFGEVDGLQKKKFL